MTRTRLSLATLASLAALVAAGCGSGSNSSGSSGDGGVPSDAVATVAGKSVTRAELDELMKTSEPQYKQRTGQDFPKPGTAEYQALQQQGAVYLVTREEYEQEAAALSIIVADADVDKGLDALIKKYFKGDRKKFDAYLKTTGYTVDEFKTSERRQLLENRLIRTVTKDVKVPSAEIRPYYESHKDSPPYTTTPAQRRVRHILVALNAKGTGVSEKGVTDTNVDFPKSKKLADKVYAQLEAGASFVALVKKYSQDPGSIAKGGEYTEIKGQFAKEFEAAAFSLETNEISKPVKTQFGYHLIQPLSALEPAKTQTFAEAEKGIRKTLLEQKQQAAFATWVAALGKKYKGKVKYAAGFAPPAASTTTTSQ